MPKKKYKYDVFISYSSSNKDWVRNELLPNLENAGLKVCIDFRDFLTGKPAIKNMRDSILESRHTLLILTNDYLNSGWTDFENLLTQTIDPANRNRHVIPLLKEKCVLPLEIGYLTYVNFFDPDDWTIAWNQLFTSLGVSNAQSKSSTRSPKSVAAKPTTSNSKPAVRTTNLQKLADAFYNCSTFRDRNTRDVIVDQLAPDIIGIRRNSIDKVDVFNIISRCIEYPDGISLLISLVENFEGPTIAMENVKRIKSAL